MQLQFDNQYLPYGGWQQCGNLFFAGYAHYRNKPLDLPALVRALNDGLDQHKLTGLLNELNGAYALVFKKDGLCLAAVDTCRSIPLFYTDSVVSDSLSFSDASLDEHELEKLPFVEFVQNDKTALKDWKQLQAGHCLWQEGGEGKVFQYFNHYLKDAPGNHNSFSESFLGLIDGMQQRLVESLNGRPAVVPLSGGYDSRFVLAMLSDAGYSNVQAFTYGRPDGHEALIAEKVCDALNVNWHFVEYTTDLFNRGLNEQWDDYFMYAGNHSSVPHEQEYLALFELKDKLDKNSVILPGFAGDVQAGSFIPDKFYEKRWFKKQTPAREYVLEYFTRLPDKDWLDAEETDSEENFGFDDFYGEIEEWAVRERIAKYIVNSVRCYEYFGYSWMLPLWDKGFIELWQKVPLAFRRDKQLYLDVLRQRFFKPMEIDFTPRFFDAKFSSGNWRSWARYVLPKGLKEWSKKVLIPENELEVNNLDELGQILANRIGFEFDERMPLNEIMGRYYVYLLKLKRKGK